MEARAYQELSDIELLSLAVWREARGEGLLGKRGVACVVRNRVNQPGWWGRDWQAVILHAYQFSSFNLNDPNSSKWPEDTDPSFIECLQEATAVYNGEAEDVTSGATYYWSPPLKEAPRHAWGLVEETVRIGNLHFCKPIPPDLREVTAG